MSFASGLTGWYISATGRYIDCVRLGFAFSALGFVLLMDLTSHQTWSKIIIFQIICGISIGPNFQALLLALKPRFKRKTMRQQQLHLALPGILPQVLGS
jgi:hypothetical protein